MITKYISFALLLAISLIHIFSLAIQNRKLKSITKIFILPLIIVFYCVSTSSINWILFSALVLGWIGDIILIPKQKLAVAIGGCFFLVEQILLIIAIALNVKYNLISKILVCLLPLTFASFSTVFLVFFVKKYVKTSLFLLGSIYLAINGITNSFALTLLIMNPNLYTGLLFVGTFLFFISDTILCYVRMCPNPKIDKKHIFIMCSYILAQFLIAFAFI